MPVVYLPDRDPVDGNSPSVGRAYSGVTWVELALDSRLATGQPLVGVGRVAEGTMKGVIQTFRTVVRRVVQITEPGRVGLPSKASHRCRAVLPLGGPVLPGFLNRASLRYSRCVWGAII